MNPTRDELQRIATHVLARARFAATGRFGLRATPGGFGTPPPVPSWGRMLQESQELLFTAPRLAVYPGVAIALTVLGLNLLGDGLRDRLDPRLVRRGPSL